jgi:hypothetical protein
MGSIQAQTAELSWQIAPARIVNCISSNLRHDRPRSKAEEMGRDVTSGKNEANSHPFNAVLVLLCFD